MGLRYIAASAGSEGGRPRSPDLHAHSGTPPWFDMLSAATAPPPVIHPKSAWRYPSPVHPDQGAALRQPRLVRCPRCRRPQTPCTIWSERVPEAFHDHQASSTRTLSICLAPVPNVYTYVSFRQRCMTL